MFYLPTDENIKEQMITDVREARDFVLMEMAEVEHNYNCDADTYHEKLYWEHKKLTDILILLTTID